MKALAPPPFMASDLRGRLKFRSEHFSVTTARRWRVLTVSGYLRKEGFPEVIEVTLRPRFRALRRGRETQRRPVRTLPAVGRNRRRRPRRAEMFNPRSPATAYDHRTTIVAVVELSGTSWLFDAVAPGVARRTKRSFEARDVDGVARALEQLKAELAKAGFPAARFGLGYEAGRDGFSIARAVTGGN